MWSPMRFKNQRINHFYETMREVAPGDLVFSFVDTRIAYIGRVLTFSFECPKPMEFGKAGQYWENLGWKVGVKFTELRNKIRPKDHMDVIRSVLPDKYSPLQHTGNGLQSVYLAELPISFAQLLMGLIGSEARRMVSLAEVGLETEPRMEAEVEVWERKMEAELCSDARIDETEKRAIISARRGQGLFKKRVMDIEKHCRITKVDRPIHLVASHCKPWRNSSNDERLNGENGLLLTPSIDRLFDQGFIGFEDSGALIISPVAHTHSLRRMGIDTSARINVGSFSSGQKKFLECHRNTILKQSMNSRGPAHGNTRDQS